MFFYIFKPEKTLKKCKITNNKNIFTLFFDFFCKNINLFVKILILFVITSKTYIKCTNTKFKACITTNNIYGVYINILKNLRLAM